MVDKTRQLQTAPEAYQSVVPEKASDGDTDAFDVGSKLQLNPIGSSGTEIYGGYFAEEFLTLLRGRRGAKIWEEMLRSEPQIAMLNEAVTNPIKAANWAFEAAQDVPNSQLHADLAKAVITEMIDFEAFLHESLTFFRSGFSMFEVIHNVVHNHPKFGTFNGIRALAFRSQKTIERWNLEPITGKLLGVDQYVYSDVGTNSTMLGEFLLIFSRHKEGDNYEGVSALRPMYGPWIRKNLYLKLAAIGVEKSAVGVPIGTTPVGTLDKDQLKEFKKILAAFTSHESSYILKPSGWDITVEFSDFDPSKLKELIVQENTEMANAVVANFLALGMSGGGGAYALGTDLSDFFLSGIQNYANIICGVINRNLIPNLIKMNFGEQSAYPKMTCSGINDKAGKELADIVVGFINAGVWKADDKLDEFLRAQFKFPAADPATARETPKSAAPGGFPPASGAKQFSETRITLDEKYVAQFDDNAKQLKSVMTDNLTSIYSRMKDDIRKAWKSAAPADRIKIGSQLVASGTAAYKAQMKESLSAIAQQALDGAQKETRSSVKLAEPNFLKNAPRGGFYQALPPNVRKIIDAQNALITDSQVADLTKVVSFTFTSEAAASDDINTVIDGIDDKAEPFLDGVSVTAGSFNTVANVNNQARMDYFFDPEVLDGIESFTFTNEDPISEICQSLAGTTVSVNAPELDQYATPLHHNCKSRWVPNMKGDDDNPDIERGGIAVSQKALDSITLGEKRCKH